MAEDYYEILGVKEDVNAADLQKAYRKLAKEYHPDNNLGEEADEKFQKISKAYGMLSDPEKRSVYDYGKQMGKGAAAADSALSLAPEQPRYVGLNARMIASTIDTLVLLIIAQPFIDMIGDHFWAVTSTGVVPGVTDQLQGQPALMALEKLATSFDDPNAFPRFIFSNIAQLIALGLLSIGCWGAFGKTPGMFLMRMRIVEDYTYEPIGFLAATIRFFGYFLALLPVGLGFIWIVWDKKKQGWHDKLAGTVVIAPPKKPLFGRK